MIHFLIALVFTLPLIIGVFEFSSYMTYGGFIKTKDVNKALDFHIPMGAELNPFDTDIINIGKMPYISTTKSPLGLYYISEVGRVWTFSSAHNRIARLHKLLLLEEKKQPKQSIEEKLKIK